jgi:hypothetical protein
MITSLLISLPYQIVTKLIVSKDDFYFVRVLNRATVSIRQYFNNFNAQRIVGMIWVFNPNVWTFGIKARHKGNLLKRCKLTQVNE